MKLRIIIFLLSAFCNYALAQLRPVNADDVSSYSSMCFNTHAVTGEQMRQMENAYRDMLMQRDARWSEKRNIYEQGLQEAIAGGKWNPHTPTTVTIPVVVHVLYNASNTNANISAGQILSQIQVLNRDFSRTNSDTVNTPAPFRPLAANTGIQFCLAQRDPNGNPSSGIERRQTTIVTFTANDAMKHFAQGGLDAWDVTQYLNIWVVDFGNSGLLGYGEFPTGTPSQTYGAVVQYNAFGNTGNVIAPYDLGRTCTKEVSHCLNLYHIWGDDGNACTGTDYCADTPNQAGPTSGCFTFPHTDACTPSGNGIMFMNYMDFSDDTCMNLFTQNQSARMNAVLSTTPYNTLTTSSGCQPVILTSDDAAIISVTTPNGNICSGTFSPVIILKNWGSNTLTSCTINYWIDANAPSTYNWNGTLSSLGTVPVTLGSLSTTAGAHTFTAATGLPNGNPDSQPSNDSITVNFSALSGGAALPYSEGFESTTFVPTGWSLVNPDNYNTWARTTQAFKTGVASAYMDNFTYSVGLGQSDDMIMKSLDLSTVSNPVMTFNWAYTYHTDNTGTYTDTLGIFISVDCGVSWTQIYEQGGAQFVTASPVPNSGSPFIPASSQWGFQLVSLAPYQNSANAMIRFRNISGYGDQLYLDNINVMNANGVNDADISSLVNIFPNPGSGEFFVNMHFISEEHAGIYVYDVLGREITRIEKNKVKDESLKLDLSNEEAGIYFVEVVTDRGSTVKKIVLRR